MFKRLAWIGIALLVLLGGVLALAAASGPRPHEPAAAPVRALAAPAASSEASALAGDVLTLRGGSGLFTLDAASGNVRRQLTQGVLAPDGSVLYDTVAVGTAAGGQNRWETVVRAVDARTGDVLRKKSVEGKYGLPWVDSSGPGGLSPDGRWLVLEATVDLSGADKAPHRSRFVVLDTAFARPPRQVSLDGVFTFDALDDDARALYLIEYLPDPETGVMARYRVRFYDLAAGALDPNVIADKRNAEQVMTGTRLDSVASADGHWLYSLYLNDVHGPFVHVLNLTERYALCIDLPDTAKQDAAAQAAWSLLRASDGRTLYAANGALGVVALVDTVDLKVARVVQLPTSKASAGDLPARALRWLVPAVRAKGPSTGGAALSPDGRTLWVAARLGLLAIDTRSWRPLGYYLPDRPLASIAVSPDGNRLYAVSLEGEQGSLGRLVRLDAADGRLVAEVAVVESFSDIIKVESPSPSRP